MDDIRERMATRLHHLGICLWSVEEDKRRVIPMGRPLPVLPQRKVCCKNKEKWRIKQKLDDGSVKFEVLCDKDRTPKKAQVMGHLERRVLEVNRKRIKVVKPGSKTSFPTTEVELYRSDQHRFKIVVDGENEVDLMVQTRHMRDVIILVIRGLAQKFNSTSLNTLLKIEA